MDFRDRQAGGQNRQSDRRSKALSADKLTALLLVGYASPPVRCAKPGRVGSRRAELCAERASAAAGGAASSQGAYQIALADAFGGS